MSQAQESDIQIRKMDPKNNCVDGITYDHSLRILERERQVKYGEPLGIVINKKDGSVNIFSFDDIVIRVSLDELLSQPNRTGPNESEQK